MDCKNILDQVLANISRHTAISSSGSMCRLQLPYFEPSGDSIVVTIEQRGAEVVIHDGGRVQGMLADIGPSGPTKEDISAIQKFAKQAELVQDLERGTWFVVSSPSEIPYWATEVARFIMASASLLPLVAPKPRRKQANFGHRLALEVANRLAQEGLAQYMQPRKAQGASEREYRIPWWYVRRGVFGAPDQPVFAFAVDLSGPQGMKSADQAVITASDLVSSPESPVVRLIYGTPEVGAVDREERATIRAGRNYLTRSFARLGSVEGYAWDDSEGRSAFFEAVHKEIAPLQTVAR